MQKRQRGFGIVEIVILVGVAVAVGAGVWYVWQRNQVVNTPAPVVNQSQEPAPEPVKETTKKYVNTKYGYSFEYPVDAVVYEDGTFGGEKLPLTATADSMAVEVGEKRVTVSGTGYTVPIVERVQQEFSSTVLPQDIIITQTTLGGGQGLKATFKDPKYTASFYFVHKGDNEPVLKISMSAGLESIISSFKFE